MKIKSRAILGGLLLAGGVLLLLQSMDLLQGSLENIVWVVALGFTAIFSLIRFANKRKRWIWLIFGISALGGMAAQLLTLINPELGTVYNEVIILAAIGISFMGVYFNDRLQWWAMMPGGVLITLGAVTFFTNTNYFYFDNNAVFFLGMGLTFLLLFLIPTKIGRLKWTLYAAIPLLLVGFFILYQGDSKLWQYAGPVLIILAGIYFFVGSFIRRLLPKKPKAEKTEPKIEIIPPQF